VTAHFGAMRAALGDGQRAVMVGVGPVEPLQSAGPELLGGDISGLAEHARAHAHPHAGAAMAEAAAHFPLGPERVAALLDAGRGELVVERFALAAGSRARSLSPAVRVPVGEVAAAASGDPLVELPAGLSGTPAVVPERTPASALALAVARAPRVPSAGPASASYSRPSAAEERHGSS